MRLSPSFFVPLGIIKPNMRSMKLLAAETFSGRSQIHSRWRSEASGPDDEDLRVQQLLLPFEAHLFQNDMPGVAFQLFTAQHHRNRLP